MHLEKYIFVLFLISNNPAHLFSCPLCLSLPKKAETPFFADHTQDPALFSTEKAPQSSPNQEKDTLHNSLNPS